MPSSRDGDIYTAAEQLGIAPADVLDFSGDVSPAPLPEAISAALAESTAALTSYPDQQARKLRALAAGQLGAEEDEILVGSGETEFIYAIPRALRPRRVVIVAPCRHEYWRANDAVGAESEGILSAETHEFIPQVDQIAGRLTGVDMIVIGNPNNPTGVALPADSLRVMAEKYPNTTFVVDETYAEFVPENLGVSLLTAPLPPNMIVLRSPAPLRGLAGLRIGFMIASPEICATVQHAREPFTLSALSIRAAEAVYSAPIDCAAAREPIIAERERLRDALSHFAGLRIFRSYANFFLVKVTRPSMDSAQVCARMLQRKVLIRNAASFRGLDGKYMRVVVRTPPENDALIAAFRETLEEPHKK